MGNPRRHRRGNVYVDARQQHCERRAAENGGRPAGGNGNRGMGGKRLSACCYRLHAAVRQTGRHEGPGRGVPVRAACFHGGVSLLRVHAHAGGAAFRPLRAGSRRGRDDGEQPGDYYAHISRAGARTRARLEWGVRCAWPACRPGARRFSAHRCGVGISVLD